MKFSKVLLMFLSTVLVSVPFSFSSIAMDKNVVTPFDKCKQMKQPCPNCSNCSNISPSSYEIKYVPGPKSGYGKIHLRFPKRQIYLPCGCCACFDCCNLIPMKNCKRCGKELPKDFSPLECFTDDELMKVWENDITLYFNKKNEFLLGRFAKDFALNSYLRDRLHNKLLSDKIYSDLDESAEQEYCQVDFFPEDHNNGEPDEGGLYADEITCVFSPKRVDLNRLTKETRNCPNCESLIIPKPEYVNRLFKLENGNFLCVNCGVGNAYNPKVINSFTDTQLVHELRIKDYCFDNNGTLTFNLSKFTKDYNCEPRLLMRICNKLFSYGIKAVE